MGKSLNLKNKRFGKLVALQMVGKSRGGSILWKCKCDCGNYKIVDAHSLSHITRSCGCLEKEKNKLIDHVGERYGRLVIIRKADGDRHNWWVRCDCGNEKIVKIGNLIKSTKSCGCYRRELAKNRVPPTIKNKGVAAKNALYSEYKRSAMERNYAWELSMEQFEKLTKGNCYYCDRPPHKEKRGCNGNYKYNGIDRVNNELGYITNNVVSCCKTCNRAKDVMSEKEFIEWIKLVFNHNKNKSDHGKEKNW